MPQPYFDDDEDGPGTDDILDLLSGEVDGYAGKGIGKGLGIEEGEPGKSTKLLTLEISVTPGGAEAAPAPGGEEEEEEHDPVAHALGMCGGGCPGE